MQEEGEDGDAFSKCLGCGERLCQCGEQGRNHCKGKTTGGKIWGLHRGLRGGCCGVEQGLDEVWDGKCHGPLLPLPKVSPLDRGCPLDCSPLDDEDC